MAEVALAATRMRITLEEANDWVLRLLQCYEHVFTPDGNPGFSFEEVYDLRSLTPKDTWLKLYEDVKAELKGMGLVI